MEVFQNLGYILVRIGESYFVEGSNFPPVKNPWSKPIAWEAS